jgi:TP901 family phage tail tape measure protein
MPGLAGEVANLIVALKLDDSGFSGRLNAASRQLRQMDAGLSQMGRGAGQVAGGLARVGTVAAAAAAGGLAAIVTTAASFEQAWTGVEKTVEGTDEQLAELEQTFRRMARTMPVSFEELAAIGEAGGALGIARADLDEFADVVARLAVSTDLTSDAAATSLGQLGNVLHLSGQDFEDFADSLVALGNAGASTESQIVEIAARFGAAGNSAGLTTEEILALSSAVASMGIEVEAGGSSLSRIFSNVATAIGTGSDDVEAFTTLLGISADEFQQRWGEDALGTFQDFLEELSKLDQFGQARVLEQAGITGVRDINAVRLMAQNFEFLNEQLNIAETATGALGTESDKFFRTTAAQWQTLKNNVRDAAAVLGTDLLPVVNEVMGDFVEFLAQPGTQAGLKDFATDLADGVRGLAAELKGTDFSGIIGGIRLTAEIAKGAFDAFRALPAPIQQLAIAALVANKVTGGAIGQIARGLGNLVLGSLKTITAGHVTVIGGTVTGGPGGLPATAGRGGLVAGAVGTAGAAAVIGGGILAIEDIASGTEKGMIRGILSQGVSGLIGRALGDPIQELINGLSPAIAQAGPGPGTGNRGGTGTSEWARGLDGVKQSFESGTAQWARGLNDLKTTVAKLPDTAMPMPVANALTGNLPSIRANSALQLMQLAMNAAATRSVAAQIGLLAQRAQIVNVDNNITIPVTVNSSVVQNQIYRSEVVRSPTAPRLT